MDSLNTFEKVVISKIDDILKEQNYINIKKNFLENGVNPVEITQTILESKDYPKTYKYIVGNKYFVLQFYDRTRNEDGILKAIVVLSSMGDIGFNLQFDTEYHYCGTRINLSDEIIKDVESANGDIEIIKKILNYIL